MKRIVCFGFAVLTTLALSLEVAQAARKQVVFINPGKQGEVFWELTTDTMRIASRQLGFDLEVLWSERNKFTMQTLGRDVAARSAKPDLMILVNEENAAAPILKAAEDAGIKTFFLLHPSTMSDGSTAAPSNFTPKHLIGALRPDMIDAGHRMAEYLVAAARKKGLKGADGKFHLLALAGDRNSPTSLDRTRGFLDYVKKHDDIVVDRLLYSNWNRSDAAQLSERYLDYAKQQNVKVAGVWGANDPIAMGAIDAIELNLLRPGEDIMVVGLNWSGEAIKLIQEGRLLMSDGGHFFGGAWSMVILHDIMSGCNLMSKADSGEPFIMFPMSPITKSTDPVLTSIIVNKQFARIDFKKFTAGDKGCRQYDFSFNALLRAMADSTVAN